MSIGYFLKRKNAGLFIIALTYVFTFIYMLPLRNQTFQDDWAYIQTAKYFYSGNFKISDWVAPVSITPTIWTTFFTRLLGFSIVNIHLSVITLLFIGLISFYFLLKTLKLSEWRATFFSLLLLSFPWVFQFSYSFITEVPYMIMLILALLFYCKAFQEKRDRLLLIGSVFAALAYLTRQLGIALPIAVVMMTTYESVVKKRILWKKFIFSILPFGILFGIYSYWLTIPGNMTNPQYQVKVIFQKQVLPYLFPLDLGRIEATFGYYATYISRILFYFHNAIGFLLPVFIVFNYKLKFSEIKKSIRKNKGTLISLSATYLSFTFIEIFYHFQRVAYTIEVPSLVTRYMYFLPIRWLTQWKYFVIISVPIWIFLLSKTVGETFDSMFKKRKRDLKKLFVLLILGLIFAQFATFRTQFRHRVPSHISITFLNKLQIYLNSIFSNDGWLVFRQSFVVLAILSIALAIFIYLITHFSLRKRLINRAQFFVALTFLTQFSMTVVLAYFQWAQYIISLIPFFILFLALSTEKLKIGPARATLVILLLLINSVTATKRRYAEYGIRFEMGVKLVEMGAGPSDIPPYDESWDPWWYYEKSFEEAVKTEFDGNKYAIAPGQTAVWRGKTYSDHPYLYTILAVPLDFSNKDNKYDIVLDTGPVPYDLFTTKRYIAYKVLK